MRAEEGTLADISGWYFGLADKFPAMFSEGELFKYWSLTTGYGDSCVNIDTKDSFVSMLRAGALKILRQKASKCEACPLHKYRLPAGAVLDDGSLTNDPFGFVAPLDKNYPVGATTAKIMLVSEGLEFPWPS